MTDTKETFFGTAFQRQHEPSGKAWMKYEIQDTLHAMQWL